MTVSVNMTGMATMWDLWKMHRILTALQKMGTVLVTEVVLTIQIPVIPKIRVMAAVITEIMIIRMKVQIMDTAMVLTVTVTITETTPAIRNRNNKTTDQSDTDDFVCLTAPGFQIPGCFFSFSSIL